MPSSPRIPYTPLFSRLKDREGLTLDQMSSDLRWEPMRISRFLQGKGGWTDANVTGFVRLTAHHTNRSEDIVWSHLFRKRADRLLSEIEACNYWRPTQQNLLQLADLIHKAVSPEDSWVYVGRSLPPWLMPEEPLELSTRVELKRLGVRDRSIPRAWLNLLAKLREKYFPSDPDRIRPIKGSVMIPQGDFIAILAHRAPLDCLDSFDLGDCIDMVAHGVPERGGHFGVLVDSESLNGKSPLIRAHNLESFLLVNGRFIFMRASGSTTWVTCERTGDPWRDQFIDEQILWVKGLDRFAK